MPPENLTTRTLDAGHCSAENDGRRRGVDARRRYDGDGRTRMTTNMRRTGWLNRWLKVWFNVAILFCTIGQVDRKSVGKSIHHKFHLVTINDRLAERRPFWQKCERVGEARHPGPAVDGGGLSITTGNGTGWGSVLEWIGEHRGHIICAQEHRILQLDDIEYERRRAIARGWKSLWTPAVPSGTEANAASGGTVILVKSHIGMAKPPGGEAVVPGRVTAAMIETAGIGWMVVCSV